MYTINVQLSTGKNLRISKLLNFRRRFGGRWLRFNKNFHLRKSYVCLVEVSRKLNFSARVSFLIRASSFEAAER